MSETKEDESMSDRDFRQHLNAFMHAGPDAPGFGLGTAASRGYVPVRNRHRMSGETQKRREDFRSINFNHPPPPMADNGQAERVSDYHRYLAYRAQNYAGALQRKRERKAAREVGAYGRKATMRIFPDGTSGYGAYRRSNKRRKPAYRRRRTIRRVRGRGSYISDAWSWIKDTAKGKFGKWAGREVGNYFGLGDAGEAIGDWAAKKTGFGRYRKSGYGAYSGDGVQDQGVPIVSNPGGSDGAVRISHREYVCDVNSGGNAFVMQAALPINPGLSTTFPWLSTIAANFVQYKVEGMIFHFVSTSGALSTTQALGEIIMAVNYDTTEATYTNKAQMLNEVFSISKVPAADIECPVECDPQQTPIAHQYTRTGALTATQDPRFYDIGNFYLATQGQAAAVTLGELWVTYQVALYKPQLPLAGDNGNWVHYWSNTAVAAATPFGSSATKLYDSMGITFPTVNTISFPVNTRGRYMIWYQMSGTAAAAVVPLSITPTAYCSAVKLFSTSVTYDNQNSFVTPVNGTNNSVNLVSAATVDVTATGSYQALVTFSTGSTPPAGTLWMDLFIVQVPNNAT